MNVSFTLFSLVDSYHVSAAGNGLQILTVESGLSRRLEYVSFALFDFYADMLPEYSDLHFEEPRQESFASC